MCVSLVLPWEYISCLSAWCVVCVAHLGCGVFTYAKASKLAAATQGGIFSLIKSTNGMSYTYVCNICVLVLAWSTG